MTDIEIISKKLDTIQRIYGFTGVVITIILVVAYYLFWKYLLKTVEFKAKISFEKELVDYNKGMMKELARLNNELDSVSSKQIGNINSERTAILDYLSTYSHWLYGSLEIDILSFKHNNFEDINNVLNNIREAHSQCNQSWNKLKFWATDEEIVLASHDLNISILEFSHYHIETLGKLRHNLTWSKIYLDQYTLIENKDKNLDSTWTNFVVKEDERLRAENDKILHDYWHGRTDIFKVIVIKNDKFQKLARVYLNHDKFV